MNSRWKDKWIRLITRDRVILIVLKIQNIRDFNGVLAKMWAFLKSKKLELKFSWIYRENSKETYFWINWFS